MARLRKEDSGTVVTVGGDLADRYRAAGWVDADAAPVEQAEAAPEKPQRKRRSNSKE